MMASVCIFKGILLKCGLLRPFASSGKLGTTIFHSSVFFTALSCLLACIELALPTCVVAKQTDDDGPEVLTMNSTEARLVRSGIPIGIRKVTPGKWSLMQSQIMNPTPVAKEVLSIIYFDDDPGIQYARKAWIPPHSRRTLWIPVFVPKNIIVDKNRTGEFVMANANNLMIDQTEGVESILRSDGRKLADRTVFSVDTSKPITIQITDHSSSRVPSVSGLTENEIASDTLKAMRAANGLGVIIPNVNDPRLPIIAATLDSADQIVVRGNRLADDAPGRAAIRQWVQNGGHLWLMVDTMQEETCQRILGDACSIEVIDRLSLANFQSQFPDSVAADSNDSPSHLKPNIPAQTHEVPVDFVRTLVDDVDVLMTINGWPSIFKKDFGQGTILFSTIGTRALSRKRLPNEQGPNNFYLLPRTELRTIAKTLLKERQPPIVTKATLAPLVEESIGYKVPGRGLILFILSAFCLGLLAIGVWLTVCNQLAQLIWVAPAAALIATVPLVWIGTASKHAIPPTVVESQFIEAPPGGDEVFAQGLTGAFQTDTNRQALVSNSTSVFIPDRTGINDTWRMVWDDLNHFRWENVSMPAGLRLTSVKATTHTGDSMRAYGSFGPKGFEGSIDSSLTNLRDAIIASSTHVSLAVDMDGENILGPVKNRLAPGQYTAQTLLDDEQIRHQEVFRKLMDFDITQGIRARDNGNLTITDSVRRSTDSNSKPLDLIPTKKFPSQPSLLVWTDPVDFGFEFADNALRKGSALVSIPILFVRPEPNRTIRIPSVFLPYQSVLGPNNEGRSMAFDSRVGTWQKRSRGTASTLRFQLPECVLPFEPTSATIRMKINAAKRKIKIQSGRVDELVEVASTQGATGLLEYSITNPNGLKLDSLGGLHVRLHIGEVISKDGDREIIQDVDWKLDYVELQINGNYTPEQ